jgi:hypothetical protein
LEFSSCHVFSSRRIVNFIAGFSNDTATALVSIFFLSRRILFSVIGNACKVSTLVWACGEGGGLVLDLKKQEKIAHFLEVVCPRETFLYFHIWFLPRRVSSTGSGGRGFNTTGGSAM